ncbi:OmpA family protein [Bacteroidales bacterium OttesenSCG-928-L03]|nr:OmpA family protein [Bacteroidales bacterium OttesenSCG-928-L03]
MNARIKVIGKDQNRTALGIINAYLKLYPNATLGELQKAFPASLSSSSPVGEIIVPLAEASKHPDGYFLKPDEVLTLKNGQKAAIKYVWTKEDYHAIQQHAKELGIEARKVAETAPFVEGSYRLEMIKEEPKTIPVKEVGEVILIEEIATDQGEVDIIEVVDVLEEMPQAEKQAKVHVTPPVNQAKANAASSPKETKTNAAPAKKTSYAWLWWLLAALLLLLLLLLWKKCDDKKLTTEPFNAVQVEDVYVQDAYQPLREQKIATATVDINGDLVYDKSGNLVKVIIDNETIDVDAYTTEAEIYAFLLSSEKKSDWIVLDQVHFKFNEINFTDAALKQINRITAILKKYAPDAKIEIEGFSDHIGSAAENQKVSDERAEFTAQHFINDGFPQANILSAVGLRDTERLCQSDDTPTCRALNRRAEIRISKQ